MPELLEGLSLAYMGTRRLLTLVRGGAGGGGGGEQGSDSTGLGDGEERV